MRWMTGCLVLLGGAAFGCSTSNTVTPLQDAGIDTSTATFGGSACGACVTQACASAISTCGGNPECAAYLSCLDACGIGPDGNVDPTCAAACPKGSSSTGTQYEQQLNTCRTTGPGAACSACGADAGGNPIIHQTCPTGTDTNPCYLCEDNNCCHTYDACAADSECTALKTCLKDCYAPGPDGGVDAGAQGCSLFCNGQYPKGVAHWAERRTCMDVHCLKECGAGTPDPCVSCAMSKCPEAYANLHGTQDGYLLWDCTALCATGDKTCIDACIAKYPSAKAAFDAFGLCNVTRCGTQCGT